MMRIELAVVGLGYAGLSLAAAAIDAGMYVGGYDSDPDRVESLRRGESYVTDVPDDALGRMLKSGFRAVHHIFDLIDAQAYLISVPTPLNEQRRPDLTHVVAAAGEIALVLKPGNVVIFESTSYPGTTDSIVRPILECRGLVAGRDFSLAFSPERMDPGNQSHNIRNTPRLVAGLSPSCAHAATLLLSRFCESIVQVHGLREAELAKLVENIYRQVNIALANEILVFGTQLGVDVWSALQASATKPYGFQSFMPGPGVGGHCIPVDPLYLAAAVEDAGGSLSLVRAADKVNSAMPAYVVSRVSEVLDGAGVPLRGSRVLLLGVSYKANIADDRGSPAARVAAGLRALGIDVEFHDPHCAILPLSNGEWVGRVGDLAEALPRVDLAVLLQGHSCYLEPQRLDQARRILDTRGILRGSNVVRI